MMRIRHAIAALLMGAAVLAAPGVATAAYPGANGRIAFEQGGVIYSIRSDGSDRRQLTSDTRSTAPAGHPMAAGSPFTGPVTSGSCAPTVVVPTRSPAAGPTTSTLAGRRTAGGWSSRARPT